jgi:hypothetical protein
MGAIYRHPAPGSTKKHRGHVSFAQRVELSALSSSSLLAS